MVCMSCYYYSNNNMDWGGKIHLVKPTRSCYHHSAFNPSKTRANYSCTHLYTRLLPTLRNIMREPIARWSMVPWQETHVFLATSLWRLQHSPMFFILLFTVLLTRGKWCTTIKVLQPAAAFKRFAAISWARVPKMMHPHKELIEES